MYPKTIFGWIGFIFRCLFVTLLGASLGALSILMLGGAINVVFGNVFS